MFKNHKLLNLPTNLERRLLRYITLPKFLSMIQSKSLYLPNANIFNDKWEGELSEVNNNIDNERLISFYDGLNLEQIKNLRHRTNNTFRALKKCTFISSWNLSEYESPFLWNTFTQPDNGILLSTTVQNLINSIGDKIDFYLGKVNYYKRDKWFIGEDNTLRPFIWKNIEYQHENEIRLLIQDENILDKDGLEIKVDLDILISEIVIPPKSNAWFKELVINTLIDYDLENVYVRNSDLDKLP